MYITEILETYWYMLMLMLLYPVIHLSQIKYIQVDELQPQLSSNIYHPPPLKVSESETLLDAGSISRFRLVSQSDSQSDSQSPKSKVSHWLMTQQVILCILSYWLCHYIASSSLSLHVQYSWLFISSWTVILCSTNLKVIGYLTILHHLMK